MKRLFLLMFIFFLTIPIHVKALEISTIYCHNSSVLAENITVYMDNNISTLSIYKKCDYGCDNTTNICNPPEYQQDLIIFGAIILFIIFIIYLDKRLK